MGELTDALPVRKQRTFLNDDLLVNTWEAVEPYFKDLAERPIESTAHLEQWLQDWSELDAALAERARWIYVSTTVDTRNEQAKTDLNYMYAHVYPNMTAYEYRLKKKFIESPFVDTLDQEIFYTTLRKIRKEIELFRTENIALQQEVNIKQSRFDEIIGAQSIRLDDKQITVQQAIVYLKNTDRKLREEVFCKLSERRLQDADKLDNLLTELIQSRHQMALNAGYKNYVDFKFDELGRFDYTPEDCLQFHDAVSKVVVPLVHGFAEERKRKLKLDKLRPWDTEVDINGQALQPFNSTEELVQKTIECFNLLDPYFGERISIMDKMHYLDLDSRMHKGMGGYNVSMPEIGVPFIFMNSVNSDHDLITMVHEGGHAIQTFLTHQLHLHVFKELTSEIAEVASMSMELLSMEHWDIFYPNAEDLQRAKKNHLQYIITLLPKACQGDSFQFWLYTNPNHTHQERRQKWSELVRKFGSTEDYSGYEDALATGYQRVLHFYIVPFYYIEYAFAQLGAIAIWRNFKHNPEKCIADYKNALSFGYTKTIPEFYEAAGTNFDFSEPYIASLIQFLQGELSKL